MVHTTRATNQPATVSGQNWTFLGRSHIEQTKLPASSPLWWWGARSRICRKPRNNVAWPP